MVDVREKSVRWRCAMVLLVSLAMLVGLVAGAFLTFHAIAAEVVAAGIAGVVLGLGGFVAGAIVLVLVTEDDSWASAGAWTTMLAGATLIFVSGTAAYLGWFGERVPATVTAVEPCAEGGCQERIRFSATAGGRDLGWTSSCGEVMRVGAPAEVLVDPRGLVASAHRACTASGWFNLMPVGGLVLFLSGPVVLVVRQVEELAPTDEPDDDEPGWG